MPPVITIAPGVNELFLPPQCRTNIEGWSLQPTLPKFPPNGFTWIIPTDRFDHLLSVFDVPKISDLSDALLNTAKSLMLQERGLSLKTWSDLVQKQKSQENLSLALAASPSIIPLISSGCAIVALFIFACGAYCKYIVLPPSVHLPSIDPCEDSTSPDPSIKDGRNVVGIPHDT